MMFHLRKEQIKCVKPKQLEPALRSKTSLEYKLFDTKTANGHSRTP